VKDKYPHHQLGPLGTHDRQFGGQFIRGRAGKIAIPAHHVARLRERVPEPAGGRLAQRIELKAQFGHHAEIARAAAGSPQKVGIVAPTCAHDTPVGEHDLRFEHVVARRAVFAGEHAFSAAEHEPAETDVLALSHRGDQPMALRGALELDAGDSGLGAREAPHGIDLDPFHLRQIDHDSAVDSRKARLAVAA